MPADFPFTRMDAPVSARTQIRRALAAITVALATLPARSDDQATTRSPAWRDLLTKLMTPPPSSNLPLPLPLDTDPPVSSSARLDENRIVATETGALDIHVRDTEIDVVL